MGRELLGIARVLIAARHRAEVHYLAFHAQRNRTFFGDVYSADRVANQPSGTDRGLMVRGAPWLLVTELTNPRSIQTTTRRNIATVQHSTTSQIKNRIIRVESSFVLVGPCCHRMQVEKA
jgi:hypothetical protein